MQKRQILQAHSPFYAGYAVKFNGIATSSDNGLLLSHTEVVKLKDKTIQLWTLEPPSTVVTYCCILPMLITTEA